MRKATPKRRAPAPASAISPASPPLARPDRIVRRLELRQEFLGDISQATLYRMISTGEFPRPLRLSRQLVGWPLSVVQEWIADKKANQTPNAAA